MKKFAWQTFIETLVSSTLSVLKILLMSKPVFNRLPKASSAPEFIVLGNGPSLNAFLLEHRNFLQGKDTLCVNLFPVSNFYTEIQPNYFLINAPEMWISDVDAHYIETRSAIFEAVAKKTQWPLVLFIPFAARKYQFWQDIVRTNAQVRITYYNTTPVEGFKSFIHFCFRHQLGMPRPHNVLIPSIMLALHLQYKCIYLAGADHSWLKDLWVSDDNQVLLTQKHFYDEKTAQAKPMQQLGRNQRKLHEVLIKFVYSFQGYFVLKDYAASQKAEIVNITPSSYIDAFKRRKLS